MSKVWVQAVNIVRVDENGVTKTVVPGNWIQMGKHQARTELALGNIKILRSAVLQSVQDLLDCTILFRGTMPEELYLGLLRARFPGVPLQQYDGRLPDNSRFLVWHTSANLKRELIGTGFGQLNKFQLAVPLWDYSCLAEGVGTAEDRRLTKEIIHDLRVPIYDDRVIFARNCKETRQLFEQWDGTQLGFLRALYQSRALINALPPTWVLK